MTSTRTPLQADTTSELMHHHLPCRAIDGHRTIAHVSDRAGHPVLFSIGTDQHLYITLSDADTHAGWKQYDISAHLQHRLNNTKGVEIAAFDVAVTPDRLLQLVVAVRDLDLAKPSPREADPQPYHLYVTRAFDVHDSDADWTTFCAEWKELPLTELAGSLLVGAHRVQRTGWLDGRSTIVDLSITTSNHDYPEFQLTSTGQLAPSAIDLLTVLFDPNRTDGSPITSPLPLADLWALSAYRGNESGTTRNVTPADARRAAMRTAVGSSGGSRGAFYLTRRVAGFPGSRRALAFNTFAAGFGPNDNLRPSREFPIDGIDSTDRDQVIAVTTPSGGTDLFLVGNGIHLFPDAVPNKPPIALADGTQLPEIEQISITRRTDHRYVIYASTREDGALGLWMIEHDRETRTTRAPMRIDASILEFASCRTVHAKRNEVMVVRSGPGDVEQLWHLTQDPETRIWRERQLHFDTRDDFVELTSYSTRVRLRGGGTVLPVQAVELSASRWVHLWVNGRPCDVAPDRPATVRTSPDGTLDIVAATDDLAAAEYRIRCDGYDSTVRIRPHEVAMARMSDKSVSEIQAFTGSDEHTAAVLRDLCRSTVRPDVTKRALTADPLEVPVHISFQAGRMAITRDQRRSLFDGTSGLEVFFGDAIQWVRKTTTDFVMSIERTGEEIVRVALEIAGQVYGFLARGVEEATVLVSTLVNKTVDTFEDVVAFVGFLFDWDDILRMHRTLVDATNQLFDRGQHALQGVEAKVQDGFERLKANLRSKVEQALTHDKLRRPIDDFGSSAPVPEAPGTRDTLDAPNVNWGRYHLQHSGALHGEAWHHSEHEGRTVDVLQAFMDDVVGPVGLSIQEELQRFGTDLARLDLSTSSLADVLTVLGTDALLLLADAAEQLIIGLLHLVEDVLSLGRDLVNRPLNIPFFSSLYREITHGSELSLLDLVGLVLAVPVTILAKLVGQQPLDTDWPTTAIDLLDRGEARLQLSTSRKRNEVEVEVTDAQWKTWQSYGTVGGLCYLAASGVLDGLTLYRACKEMAEIMDEASDESSGDSEYVMGASGKASLVGAILRLARQAAFVPNPYSQFQRKPKQQDIHTLEWAIWCTNLGVALFELVTAIWAVCSGKGKSARSVAQGIVGVLEAIGVVVIEAILTDWETKEIRTKLGEALERLREAYEQAFHTSGDDLDADELIQKLEGLELDTEQRAALENYPVMVRKQADLPLAMFQNSAQAVSGVLGGGAEIVAPFAEEDPEPDSKAITTVAVFALVASAAMATVTADLIQLGRIIADVNGALAHRVH